MKPHAKLKRWHFSRRTRIILLDCSLVLVGLFVLANGVLWLMYRNRTYPNTKVMGHAIGSVAYDGLAEKVRSAHLFPDRLTFTYGGQRIAVSLTDLGVSQDITRTTRSAEAQKAWLPIMNVLSSRELLAPVKIDSNKLRVATSQQIGKTIHKDTADARLTLAGSTVGIAAALDGYNVDSKALESQLQRGLDAGKTTIEAPVTVVKPAVQASALQDKKSDLEAQIKTAITLNFGGKNRVVSSDEIASWFVASGQTYVAATDKIQTYIVAVGKEFGIRVKDAPGVATRVAGSLAKHQNYTVTLEQQVAVRTFKYCAAVKGVDSSFLDGLKSRLKATYADARGWSLGGLVEFQEVDSGCDFTVWLTAANLMPSFGDICDSTWSCRVGPNVVINFDRWQGASSSWNASGGSLEEYRHMVINHESGHWLGFNHAQCPGAGLPAPVMQQQSIDLQGCAFNAWPTSNELAVLKRTLGI